MRRLPKTHKKLPMSKKDEPDFYALDKAKPLPALEDAPIPGLASTQGARSPFSSTTEGCVSIYGGQQPQVVTPTGGRMSQSISGPTHVMNRFIPEETQHQQHSSCYEPLISGPNHVQMMPVSGVNPNIQPMYGASFNGVSVQRAPARQPQNGMMRYGESLVGGNGAQLMMEPQSSIMGGTFDQGNYFVPTPQQAYGIGQMNSSGLVQASAYDSPVASNNERLRTNGIDRRQFVGVE